MVLRCVKLLISIVYHLLIRPIVRFFSPRESGSCVVLCYHSIKERERNRFVRQMDWLEKRTKVIPVGFPPAERKTRHVMITFDDAFKSVIDWCVPEFEKRSMPVTIFIPSDNIGLPPEWLKETGHEDKTETVASREALQSLPKRLVTLASHTATHAHLARLDDAEIRRQIKGSKDRLESIFGIAVEYLAFPFGEYNEAILAACRQAGYRQVFTLAFETPWTDAAAFAKGRICVSFSDWMVEFKLKAAGSYAWMAVASRAKKAIRQFLAGERFSAPARKG